MVQADQRVQADTYRGQKKPPVWRGNRRFREALLLGGRNFRPRTSRRNRFAKSPKDSNGHHYGQSTFRKNYVKSHFCYNLYQLLRQLRSRALLDSGALGTKDNVNLAPVNPALSSNFDSLAFNAGARMAASLTSIAQPWVWHS